MNIYQLMVNVISLLYLPDILYCLVKSGGHQVLCSALQGASVGDVCF